MDATELIAKLNDLADTELPSGDYADEALEQFFEACMPGDKYALDLGEFKLVFIDHLGREYEEEYNWIHTYLFKVQGEDRLYTAKVTTNSWAGAESFDTSTIKEVRPAQKVVDYYEEIK